MISRIIILTNNNIFTVPLDVKHRVKTHSDSVKSAFDYIKTFNLDIDLSRLKNYQNIFSTSLNQLLELVFKLYTQLKASSDEILRGLLRLLSFYYASRDAKDITTLTVHVVNLIIDIFDFSKFKDICSSIAEHVEKIFCRLKKYFLKAEGLTDTIKSFWDTVTDFSENTILGIGKCLFQAFTDCFLIFNYLEKSSRRNRRATRVKTLMSMLEECSYEQQRDIFDKLRNITEVCARFYDFVVMNIQHVVSGDFKSISWRLPIIDVFENEYANFVGLYRQYQAHPDILEDQNITLRDMSKQCLCLEQTVTNLINNSERKPQKTTLTSYKLNLKQIQADLDHKINPKNMKPQPLSLIIVGPAGCGKSSLVPNFGKLMQIVTGNTPDDDKIKATGGDPKFVPTITTDTEIIVCDDFGNDTSQQIPSKAVLDVVNVTREGIPKADSSEKGKHHYSNLGTIFTTNDPNLGLNCIKTVSYDSIIRRMGIILTLSPKDEYCIEGTQVLDRDHPHLQGKNFATDIYDVTLEKPLRAVKDGSGLVRVEKELLTGWQELSTDLIKSAKLKIKELFEIEWQKNIKIYHNLNSGADLCQSCRLSSYMCTCKSCTKLESESFGRVINQYNLIGSRIRHIFDRGEEYIDDINLYCALHAMRINSSLSYYHVKKLTINMMWRVFNDLRLDWKFYLILFFLYNIISNLYLFASPVVATLYFSYNIYHILSNYIHSNEYMYFPIYRVLLINILHYIVGAFIAPFSVYGLLIWIIGSYILFHWNSFQDRMSFIKYNCYSRGDWLATVNYARSFALLGGSLSILAIITIAGSRLYSSFFRNLAESSKSLGRPFVHRGRGENNDDKMNYAYRTPASNEAKTSAREETEDLISRKMLRVMVYKDGQFFQLVNGIPLGSEIIIPRHAIPKEGLFDVYICADSTKRDSEYKSLGLSSKHYTVLKNPKGQEIDAVLLHHPNMVPQKNLIKYFTKGAQEEKGPALEIYKNEDCLVEKIPIQLQKHRGFNPRYEQNEWGYHTIVEPLKCTSLRGFKSFSGMCGSPILSAKSNVILGIHVAGCESETWFGERINYQMLVEARNRLQAEGICFVNSPRPEDFDVVLTNHRGYVFNDKFVAKVTEEIDASESTIQQLGQILTKGGDPLQENAQRHYFNNRNPALLETFGPRLFADPKYPNANATINTTLKKLHSPKFDLPTNLAIRAATSYLDDCSPDGANFNDIIEKLKLSREDWFTVRSIEEATQGDNTGIIKGMNNNSSSGMFYGGDKKRHLDFDSSPNAFKERPLKDYVREDIEEQARLWFAGQGTYDPFKRSSKVNELIPIEKAKIKTRSFYGNSMTYFINATRGTMFLKAILRANMKHSEAFVGVCPQSQDWGELRDFITNDGKFTNMVCGDFSGYDTQLPKMLIELACWIVMEMAKKGGMSEEDQNFLRGALSSIASPILIWKQYVLALPNGQPSGQPLTVEINSIVNSILTRMVFYDIVDTEYPHLSNVNFRDYVKLATYGDDNAMGVHPDIPKFNHTNMAATYLRWGITYTMADKDAKSVPYLPIDQVNFLKRSFYDHPELGLVAPIEKGSITKAFYYWVRLSNTPCTFQEQFECLVQSASREAALWGRDYYEEFTSNIFKIQEGSFLDKEDFHIPIEYVDIPAYDDMIHDLKPNYRHPRVFSWEAIVRSAKIAQKRNKSRKIDS